MRKVFLLLLVFVAFKSVQAQQINTTIHTPILIHPDTLIVVYSYPYNNRSKIATENMPNAYKGMANPLTKMGTNGKGFDLYQSKPDNMVVVKPDSINLTSTYLPNGFGLDDKTIIMKRPKFNLSH